MQNLNLKKYVAEIIGTYILVFVGTASVATALYIGVLVGIFQVAILWGIGLSIAILATAPHSGAHLNPAITLALYFLRKNDLDFFQVLGYIGSQLIGAILAGITVLLIFGPFINRFEILNKITRGGDGSELSAMAFGEYFPNPDVLPLDSGVDLINSFHALGVEAFGAAILAFVIFMSLDPKSVLSKTNGLAPIMIGLTLALLISLFGSITQAGFNPARDFGPRLVSFFAGWEKIALPGPNNGFWIYIIGPIIGAPIGGLIYDKLLKISDDDAKTNPKKSK
jgi:glycerol uptake facilitator protein